MLPQHSNLLFDLALPPCPSGKRIAETLTMDYYREHAVAVRIIRIFNTYGPRMALDDGRVVSNFVAQVQPMRPMHVPAHACLKHVRVRVYWASNLCAAWAAILAYPAVAVPEPAPAAPLSAGAHQPAPHCVWGWLANTLVPGETELQPQASEPLMCGLNCRQITLMFSVSWRQDHQHRLHKPCSHAAQRQTTQPSMSEPVGVGAK